MRVKMIVEMQIVNPTPVTRKLIDLTSPLLKVLQTPEKTLEPIHQINQFALSIGKGHVGMAYLGKDVLEHILRSAAN